jgi:hypothetical protein
MAGTALAPSPKKSRGARLEEVLFSKRAPRRKQGGEELGGSW